MLVVGGKGRCKVFQRGGVGGGGGGGVVIIFSSQCYGALIGLA